jgi:hypothetical protein
MSEKFELMENQLIDKNPIDCSLELLQKELTDLKNESLLNGEQARKNIGIPSCDRWKNNGGRQNFW